MTIHPLWSDEYWVLLMQLYMKKPEGVKPMYSRRLVELSLELHIAPRHLYTMMFRLRRPDTPWLRHLSDRYRDNPRRLAREAGRIRRMSGFGMADVFYEGVLTQESFETDFRPLPEEPRLKPVMLTMILDLYFRLTPATMVEATPEVAELARTMKTEPGLVAEAMACFLDCDPCMRRKPGSDSRLSGACRETWRRYGQDEPERLAATAAQLRDYFA